jgi:hypothetical protein
MELKLPFCQSLVMAQQQNRKKRGKAKAPYLLILGDGA